MATLHTIIGFLLCLFGCGFLFLIPMLIEEFSDGENSFPEASACIGGVIILLTGSLLLILWGLTKVLV